MIIKVLFLILVFISFSFSQERGIGLVERRPELSSFYRDSWALIIGINDYIRAPKLRYAINDANEMEKVLVEFYGFKWDKIIKLIDREATKENIMKAFDKLRLSADKDDRVLIFFAGHGITVTLPDGREKGYILPVDGSQDELITSAISTDQLNEISQLIKAKHLFFIMDACYGGLIFARAQPLSPTALDYLEVISTRRARKALTAGGRDQTVLDTGPGGHSVFTFYLIDGLKNMTADLNRDGMITSAELNEYVAPRVTAESNKGQTPEYGILAGDMGGDFVFIPMSREVVEFIDVSIASEPLEADIKIDGKLIGKTPMTAKMKPGTYTVEVLKDDHSTIKSIIKVEKGADNSFYFKLEPLFVNVYVQTEPPDADVYIDGKNLGKAPSYFKVPKGEHEIMIMKYGYGDRRERFTFLSDTTIKISLNQLFGRVLIKSNVPDVNVLISGRNFGRKTFKMTKDTLTVDLPFGGYTIEISKEKYAGAFKTVEITKPELYRVDFELTKNVTELTVNAEPQDASIYVDGKFVGIGFVKVELPIKSVQVKVEKEGFMVYEKEVNLTEKPSELSVKLEPIIAKFELETNPPGAVVNIGNTVVGKTPLVTNLPYGTHKVTINLPNYKTEEITVNVYSGATIKRTITLKEKPEVMAMRIYRNKVNLKRTVTISSYGIAVGAGVYALILNSKANDYYNKYMESVLPSDIKFYRDKYTSTVQLRNIAIGVSIGFAGVGTYFLLKGVSYEEILREVKAKEISMGIIPNSNSGALVYISLKF